MCQRRAVPRARDPPRDIFPNRPEASACRFYIHFTRFAHWGVGLEKPIIIIINVMARPGPPFPLSSVGGCDMTRRAPLGRARSFSSRILAWFADARSALLQSLAVSEKQSSPVSWASPPPQLDRSKHRKI
jgi:hypothetical protein